MRRFTELLHELGPLAVVVVGASEIGLNCFDSDSFERVSWVGEEEEEEAQVELNTATQVKLS